MKIRNSKYLELKSLFRNIKRKSYENNNRENVISKKIADPHSNLVVTGKDLFENDITEVPMLWGHLLQKYGIAVLSGSSDTGKSTLLRQLAIAIVTKKDTFLDFPLNAEHYRVIYISTEDDIYSLSPRINQ